MVALSNPEQLGPPPRDGLPTRKIKEHSTQKAYYWTRYCESAATKLKNFFRGGRMCVDLYAAHGICENARSGELSWGSALVSLQVSNPYDIYFFNDLDGQAIEALTARVERYAPAGSTIHRLELEDPRVLVRAREIRQLGSFGPKIIISRGDANKAPLVVRELRPHGKRYTLALIDPEAATFQWAALEALAYQEHSLDALALFPDAIDLARGLKYYLSLPKSGAKLDAYFGTSAWRDHLKDVPPRRHEHALREFYEQRMELYLGLKPGKPKGIGLSARPLYHLIFGSKSEKGIELWNDVNKRAPWTQDELWPLD